MTKEEIFNALKNLVIELRDSSSKLKEDEVARKEWQKKQQEVGIATKALNSCDALWLSEEYSKLFNAEIKPYINNIDPSLKDKLIWK